MKSLISLSLFLCIEATAVAAQEAPVGDGPRGSSELVAGEVRYDAVGYAGSGDLPGMSAAGVMVPAGSFMEVTALDTGKTIVVTVIEGNVAPGMLVTMSSAAEAALGMTDDRFAVRLRKVTPTSQDIARLRSGRPASFRADAPLALLTALRKKLVPIATVAARPVPPRARTPTPLPARPSAAFATTGYVVQIAALSSAARAAKVARTVGGSVIAGPPLWRVRMGPYADAGAAGRAKAAAARMGYPRGKITRFP